MSTTYRWRRGFLDAIEFSHNGDELLECSLAPLAARPEARLLRRLVIDAVEFDSTGDLGPVFAELARLAPKFPRLVEIVVTEGADLGNPWVDGPIALHDVSVLYAAYPTLEVLELDGTELELHDIQLPSVRRFKATHLRVELARNFVAAQMPRLADLELSFRYGTEGNVAATYGPLLHREFAQLEALALTLPTLDQMRWLVGELPGSPLARHVRKLAFRHGPQDEPMLEVLIANVGRLRLERLELRAKLLSAVMQMRLRAVFGSALVLI